MFSSEVDMFGCQINLFSVVLRLIFSFNYASNYVIILIQVLDEIGVDVASQVGISSKVLELLKQC